MADQSFVLDLHVTENGVTAMLYDATDDPVGMPVATVAGDTADEAVAALFTHVTLNPVERQ